jgi:ribosomal protein S27AE
MKGKLHVRRPREGGLTCCSGAFLASTWASVVQDIPNDVTLGTRDWCPRCATFYARSADEDQAGRSHSSTSSQSTDSSRSFYHASERKLDSERICSFRH